MGRSACLAGVVVITPKFHHVGLVEEHGLKKILYSSCLGVVGVTVVVDVPTGLHSNLIGVIGGKAGGGE